MPHSAPPTRPLALDADGVARARGHDALSGFRPADLTTWDREMAHLAGIRYAGIDPGPVPTSTP